jgi:hypothetical protein
LTEPHPPPPDQPHEPPPDQLHEPPPDQLHEPPPNQPHESENPRRSRRGWIIATAVIVVVAVGATVAALILAPTGGSSGPDRSPTGGSSGPDSSGPDRYGQKAVDVVHELHICDNPQVDQGIATCTLQDGIGYAVVITVDDKTERDAFASEAKNPDYGCTMVANGYLVTGPDRNTLTEALGNLEAFAAQHHGDLVGGCG